MSFVACFLTFTKAQKVINIFRKIGFYNFLRLRLNSSNGRCYRIMLLHHNVFYLYLHHGEQLGVVAEDELSLLSFEPEEEIFLL